MPAGYIKGLKMRLSRSKNAKRNILVGEIDRVTGIILPFIVRTMILHIMGTQYLGLTSLFYSILQMLNLMEMGFGTAIVYSMYKPIAENDTKTINALLAFYRKVYIVVGTLVAIIGIGLMPFLPYLIKDKVPSDINIYYLYVIYLINTCINFFVFPNKKALITAFQRDDIGGRIHIFTQTAMYIGQALFVWLAKDYYLYAAMMPITSVLYSLLVAVKVTKKYPEYKPAGKLSSETSKDIKKQVTGLMIRKLAMLSRNSFDSIFISAYLGLRMTTLYSNYYYIMDSVVMILAVIKTSMAGGVGNAIAMEKQSKNLHDMSVIDFLFMWIGGWCSICLLCLYEPFMKIWVGEKMMLGMPIALMFSVYFYILKMSDIRTLYSEAVGLWWQARYISIMEALANLILNWVLIRFMGLYGIILATLISYFIFHFLGGAYILFKHYFTDGGMVQYLISHGRYMVITIGIGALTFYVCHLINFGGIQGLITKGLICAVLPNVVYFLLYFKTKNFSEAMRLLKFKKDKKENV